MGQTFRGKELPIVQLNKKTAFFSALFMNVLFLFVLLVILLYSFYMGENIGERFSERIFRSEYSIEPVNLFLEPVVLFLINTYQLYLFFRIEFWVIKRFSDNRRKSWLSLLFMFLFVSFLSTIISQLLGFWFKGELTAYQYSIIQFVKDLTLFISSVIVTYVIYLIIKNQESREENKNLAIENFKNRYNALKNQTDPHFLFNSLNSLNGLIGYDDEQAHEYVMQLGAIEFRRALLVDVQEKYKYTS